jgi:hypothetical protein
MAELPRTYAGMLSMCSETFVIDGRIVDGSPAQFNPGTSSFLSLNDGNYVRVNGTYKADGTVLNYKSMQDFTLRGVSVDAIAATIDVASCGAITALADGMQIEVRGSVSATVKVTATSIKSEKSQDGVWVVERKGKVSNVDALAKTFTLTNSKETISVQWSATTLFARVDVTALDGKTLEVEGRIVAGVLQASKVSPD